MVTYEIDHPEKGLIMYWDNKRYLWLCSVLIPLMPLTGIWLYSLFATEWVLLAPLAFYYLAIPLFDALLGTDENNPPEELVPQLEEDSYYRWLTYLTVPSHFIALFAVAAFVGTHSLSVWAILLLAVSLGNYSGIALSTAHELGHKRTRIEQTLAKILLAVPAYGHFCIEHNRGHHVDVATPEDPASARMGESFYKFFAREIPGTFKRGMAQEKKRLAQQGLPFWHWKNDVLQSYALSAMVQGSLIALFGLVMIPFLLLHNFVAWLQLSSANYIEHYGLLRAKVSDMRFERCQPHHSWNANYIFSNILLFHLERHSDHHANATRRYQSLRNFEDIPQLPNGYAGMYAIAYIPWLWYRVMDKRLLNLPHVQGDLSKVNIDPEKYHAIHARYTRGAGEALSV